MKYSNTCQYAGTCINGSITPQFGFMKSLACDEGSDCPRLVQLSSFRDSRSNYRMDFCGAFSAGWGSQTPSMYQRPAQCYQLKE